jgi:DNA-binding transcriptional LysR family regulator
VSLQWLRTFALVAECRSIVGAARHMACQPPMLGHHLRRLEEEVGSPLFWRSRHGMELTEAGRLLLDYAQRMLDLHDDLLEAIPALGVKGAVRLGIPQDLVEQTVPLLGRFSRLHGGVRIELRVDSSQTLLDAIVIEHLDLALAFTETVDGPSLGDHQAAWLGVETWTSAHDAPVPLVLCEPPCEFRDMALLALGRAHVSWRIVVTCPSLSGLWTAVRAGLGVTLRTATDVPPGIVVVDGLPRLPRLPLKVASPPGELPLAARRLRAWLINGLGERGPRRPAGPEGRAASDHPAPTPF